MACKRWSLSSKYSYSLGRVIGFKKMENIQEGLTVELTDGYNCFNRFTQKMQSAITIIKMYCDVNAGYGTPMPVKNASSKFEFIKRFGAIYLRSRDDWIYLCRVRWIISR